MTNLSAPIRFLMMSTVMLVRLLYMSTSTINFVPMTVVLREIVVSIKMIVSLDYIMVVLGRYT